MRTTEKIDQHKERAGVTRYFHPAVILTATSPLSIPGANVPLKEKSILPKQQDLFLMAYGQATVTMPFHAGSSFLSQGCFTTQGVATVTIQTSSLIIGIEQSKPFETISLDEFQKKYLPGHDERAMWEEFKKDLWQEVFEGKTSRIKYYRIINRLIQKELAEKLHTKQPNITRIEKVGYKVDLGTIKRLGEIFGIDYKELIA